MTAPLITVIIPTYNRKEKTLRAIFSVIEQGRSDVEILVVDDGSVDDTAEFLAEKQLPINLIQKENGGVSSARNTGIKNAKGKYIAFLDSDDTWLPNKLNKQIEYFEAHPEVSLVYTDQYLCIDGKDLDITRFQRNKPEDNLALPAFVQFTPVHTSTVLIKKEVLDTVGYFNETLKMHEDSELWNRVSEYGTLGFVEEVLSRYYWDSDADHLTSTKNKMKFIEEGKKYLELYVKNKKRELTPVERESVEESRKMLDKTEAELA
jgi:glycosyltransferase involved in cell wall biosynthesis